MVHHVLQRFLLTLPALWLVLTLVSMLRSRAVGDVLVQNGWRKSVECQDGQDSVV
jgi:hypothetical protein